MTVPDLPVDAPQARAATFDHQFGQPGSQRPTDTAAAAAATAFRTGAAGLVLEGDGADLLSRPGRVVVRSSMFGAGAGAVEFGGGGGNEVGRGRPAPGRQRDLWLVRGREQRRQSSRSLTTPSWERCAASWT